MRSETKCRTPSGLHSGWKIDSSASLPATRRRPETTPARVEIRHPQLGTVPRQVGEVPRQPRELRPVGRDPRGGEEVVAVHDDRRVARAVRRDGHELVDDAFLLMPFADADQERPVRRHPTVRVPDTPPGVRRDRRRRAAGFLAIEPLIGEVRGEDDASMHHVRAAPVLVHGGARVEAFGRDVRRLGTGIAANHDRSPSLRGAAFHPVGRSLFDRHVTQSNAALDEHRRADRRAPGAVRSDGGLAHLGLLPTMTRVTLSEPPFVISISRNPPRR